MPNRIWLFREIVNLPRKDKDKEELLRFWNEFYKKLLTHHQKSEQGQREGRQRKSPG